MCFSVIRSYEDYENFQLADKKEYVRMAIMSLIKIKLFTYGKKNVWQCKVYIINTTVTYILFCNKQLVCILSFWFLTFSWGHRSYWYKKIFFLLCLGLGHQLDWNLHVPLRFISTDTTPSWWPSRTCRSSNFSPVLKPKK